MKNLWQKQYSLRASDFDRFNNIKPSAILDLFQDAAGQHAEELGVGFEDMLKRGYLWVLTRVKFDILLLPARYQDVVVKTWPLEPNRLNYRREYCIEDICGNRLVKGSSEWVVIDSKERRFLSVPDLYPFKDGFHNEIMYDGKFKKVRDFKAQNPPHPVNVCFNDLDLNGHVNNIRYANYVFDAINPEVPRCVKSFQIDYRKEVLQGTELKIYYENQENAIAAKGQSGDDVMFACFVEFN